MLSAKTSFCDWFLAGDSMWAAHLIIAHLVLFACHPFGLMTSLQL